MKTKIIEISKVGSRIKSILDASNGKYSTQDCIACELTTLVHLIDKLNVDSFFEINAEEGGNKKAF